MPRIVHIAIRVDDLDKATKFYENVFGFRETGTGYARGHVSRHLTDGNIDLALMTYDSEDVEEAQLSGPGPCIHHWGIEVEDRDTYVAKIKANGGTVRCLAGVIAKCGIPRHPARRPGEPLKLDQSSTHSLAAKAVKH